MRHPPGTPTSGRCRHRPWLWALLPCLVACALPPSDSVAATPWAKVQASASQNVHESVTSETSSVQIGANGPYSGYQAYSNGGPIPEVGMSLGASVPGHQPGGELILGTASGLAANRWWFKIGPKPGFGASQSPGSLTDITLDYTIAFSGATAAEAYWWGWAELRSDCFAPKYVTETGGTWDTPLRDPPSLNADLGHRIEDLSVAYNQWHFIDIKLEAAVGAGWYDPLPDSASFAGCIDPAVLVDSAWLAAHPNDEIVFSSVKAPIPEPSSLLAVLSAGLAGIWIRRRMPRPT